MNLGELIRAYRRDTSYERLAKKAQEQGHDISGTMLHTFATKPLPNIPRVETLRAVAAALGVSPRIVLDASAESVGLTPADPGADPANRPEVQAIVSFDPRPPGPGAGTPRTRRW